MAAPLPEVVRRRLREVRGLHPAVPVLVLHPSLTVVTGFGRDASDTVVERLGRLGAPLGPAVTGTAEINGRILELPGAVVDPDARPEVVRGPMIAGEVGRLRAAAAVADVGDRAARVSRREAVLARRDQLVDRLEQLSNRADAIDRQLQSEQAVDDDELARLIVTARLPGPATANPITTAFIEEWDALVAERQACAAGPTVERAAANLEAIRTHITDRRLGVTSGTDSEVLNAAIVARVRESHEAVERLASGLDDGRRSERRSAAREIAAALDAERAALAELGFDSYAPFLLALAEGRAEEEDADHDAAALETAEAALERARDREAAFVVLSERELELRSRVSRLLGRLPGPDVGAELRAGFETVAAPTGARDRLEKLLRNAGAPVGPDPIVAAERWLEAAESRRAEHAALRAELAEIESHGSQLDRQLENAQTDLADAERELMVGGSESVDGAEAPVPLGLAGPTELTAAVTGLVAPAGPPVVVGECFDELTPQGRVALLELLRQLSRTRQVVVVTEHEDVGRWAAGLGRDGDVWSPADASEAEAENRREREAIDEATDERAPDGETGSAAAGTVPALIGSLRGPPPIGPDGSPLDPLPPAPLTRSAPVDAVVEAPEPEPEPEPAAEPEPESEIDAPPPDRRARASGPWKALRRSRDERAADSAAAPWEGRFDTSRDRVLPTTAPLPDTPSEGAVPLAVCARHSGSVTRNRCARCGEPACDECLVKARGRRKAICIECAILGAGVRTRRRRSH